MAALGGAIGLDIEHRRHAIRDIFLGREREVLHWDLGDWVAREAVTKASGASLSDVLSAPLINGNIHLCGPWPVQTFTIDDGCMAGIATPKRVPDLSFVWIDVDQILDRTRP